jgi:ABC-type lipoprotein release transport system permease subunit
VVIGELTVLLTKWQVGQEIKIFGRDFKIVGTISSPGMKSSSVWMTLDAAEALFSTHDVYQFAWIKVAKGVDSEKVKATLLNDSRINKKFDVYYADYLYSQYASSLRDLGQISTILEILSLTMVMFGTYGSIFLTLTERNREITIMRAIGFTAAAIKKILAVRTYIQISAAYLLSWGISTLLLDHIQKTNPVTLRALPLDVAINWNILLIGFVLTFIFGGLGIWIPTLGLKNSSVYKAIHK